MERASEESKADVNFILDEIGSHPRGSNLDRRIQVGASLPNSICVSFIWDAARCMASRAAGAWRAHSPVWAARPLSGGRIAETHKGRTVSQACSFPAGGRGGRAGGSQGLCLNQWAARSVAGGDSLRALVHTLTGGISFRRRISGSCRGTARCFCASKRRTNRLDLQDLAAIPSGPLQAPSWAS